MTKFSGFPKLFFEVHVNGGKFSDIRIFFLLCKAAIYQRLATSGCVHRTPICQSYCLLTADWIRVVSGLSPAMTLYG